MCRRDECSLLLTAAPYRQVVLLSPNSLKDAKKEAELAGLLPNFHMDTQGGEGSE